MVIRECREEDLAGLLSLYAELRPNDPVLAPSVAREALRRLLADARWILALNIVSGISIAAFGLRGIAAAS